MKELPRRALLQNSAIKHLTGGGTISARELYGKQKPIHLFMTLVCEVNEKPDFIIVGEPALFTSDIISKLIFEENLLRKKKDFFFLEKLLYFFF